jgi:hypothetical protein
MWQVSWIGLRMKNAGIINGGETQQLKAMKGRRGRKPLDRFDATPLISPSQAP